MLRKAVLSERRNSKLVYDMYLIIFSCIHYQEVKIKYLSKSHRQHQCYVHKQFIQKYLKPSKVVGHHSLDALGVGSKILNSRFCFLSRSLPLYLVNLTSIKPNATQCKDQSCNGPKQTIVAKVLYRVGGKHSVTVNQPSSSHMNNLSRLYYSWSVLCSDIQSVSCSSDLIQVSAGFVLAVRCRNPNLWQRRV